MCLISCIILDQLYICNNLRILNRDVLHSCSSHTVCIKDKNNNKFTSSVIVTSQ